MPSFGLATHQRFRIIKYWVGYSYGEDLEIDEKKDKDNYQSIKVTPEKQKKKKDDWNLRNIYIMHGKILIWLNYLYI